MAQRLSAEGATVVGTVVVADTVEERGAGQRYFADVRLTASFCATALNRSTSKPTTVLPSE